LKGASSRNNRNKAFIDNRINKPSFFSQLIENLPQQYPSKVDVASNMYQNFSPERDNDIHETNDGWNGESLYVSRREIYILCYFSSKEETSRTTSSPLQAAHKLMPYREISGVKAMLSRIKNHPNLKNDEYMSHVKKTVGVILLAEQDTRNRRKIYYRDNMDSNIGSQIYNYYLTEAFVSLTEPFYPITSESRRNSCVSQKLSCRLDKGLFVDVFQVCLCLVKQNHKDALGSVVLYSKMTLERNPIPLSSSSQSYIRTDETCANENQQKEHQIQNTVDAVKPTSNCSLSTAKQCKTSSAVEDPMEKIFSELHFNLLPNTSKDQARHFCRNFLDSPNKQDRQFRGEECLAITHREMDIMCYFLAKKDGKVQHAHKFMPYRKLKGPNSLTKIWEQIKKTTFHEDNEYMPYVEQAVGTIILVEERYFAK